MTAVHSTPPPPSSASASIPVTKSGWYFVADSDPERRGVWFAENGAPARRMAPLPYVHARVVRRDGTGRQIATEALASATADSPRVIIGHQALADGSYANALGLTLSDDPKVRQAASTAVRQLMGDEDTPELEAVPRVGDDGRVAVPAPECLPTGYLSCASTERGMALDAWRAIAEIVTGLGKMAYVLGLAAYGPFIQAQRRQPFVCELFGDRGQGKTTALQTAAAVWGDPFADETKVLLNWNDSPIGLGRHLGGLRILPAFIDESGMAGYTPAEWAKLLFDVTQGNQRLTAEQRGTGTRRSLPWRSVLVLSGNGQVTAGLSSGKYAGLGRRLVSIPAPFTETGEQAETLAGIDDDPGLLGSCYGHLGAELLARYSVADVTRFNVLAEQLLGELPGESTARTLYRHLAGGVAGAAMLDEILDTGTALTDAAAEFATAYLTEHAAPPEHDADRLLGLVRDSMARQPARWPTAARYGQHASQEAMGARDFAGVTDDDGPGVALFPSTLRELCETGGLDQSVTLRELHRRGQLEVTPSRRRKGEWKKAQRLGQRVTEVYRLILPPIEDGDGQDPGQDQPDGPQLPAAVPPQPRMPWGEGPAIGDEVNPPPAGAPEVRACSACGEPMTVVEAGQLAHPSCDPTPAPAAAVAPAAAARPAAAPAPVPAAAGPSEARRRFMADTRRHEVFRSDEQYAALDAVLGRLDDGRPLRLLGALEGGKGQGGREQPGPFAPILKGRQPYWTAPQPDLNPLPTSGWQHRRDGYSGEAVTLDVNAAYDSATSSARFAHGALKHTGELTELPAYPQPGCYLVAVYRWPEVDMPAPLGRAEPGSQVWIQGPVAQLIRDLAAEDRWPDSSAIDSWTAAPCHLAEWAALIREVRRYALTVYGRDSEQYGAVKDASGVARSLMKGSWEDDPDAPQHRPRCKAQRPDWARTIEAQSAVNLWRRADQCRKLTGPELAPLALRNTDELVLPAAALDVVTAAPSPGGRPPVRLDETGTEFGTFKIKARESWEG